MACLTTGTAAVRPVHKILTRADSVSRVLHAHQHGVPSSYSAAIYFLAVRELVLSTVAARGRSVACVCTNSRSCSLTLRILMVRAICATVLAAMLPSLQRSRLSWILLNRHALEIIGATASVHTLDLA